MRKYLTVALPILMLVALLVPVIAQETGTGEQAEPTEAAAQEQAGTTIADFASLNLPQLSAAVTAADLAETLGSGEFTLFAPNDGAFLTLLNDMAMSADELLANPVLLQGVLNYHVIPGRVTSADLLNGTMGVVETVHGAALSFSFNSDTSRIILNNGLASIEQPDIVVSNGIIHVIDNVLLPPNIDELLAAPVMAFTETTGDDAATTPSAAEVEAAMEAAADGRTISDISQDNFVILTEAVEAAGLTEELSSGEYTLFAPNDGAFVTLLNDMGMTYDEMLADEALLTEVLSYHLVPGTVTADNLLNGEGSVQTVNGATLSFGFNTDTSRLIINDGEASVEQPNIFATNGVVHIIDNVLLPSQG